MTITLAEDCASILVESENLTSDNQSVSLSVTLNCDTETVHPMEVTDENITIDIEEDGVYYFELTIIQENGNKLIESVCKFVNCETTCLMLDTFVDASAGDKDAIIRALAFHALSVSDGCTSCACSDLCELYNATKLINCESNAGSCGCS